MSPGRQVDALVRQKTPTRIECVFASHHRQPTDYQIMGIGTRNGRVLAVLYAVWWRMSSHNILMSNKWRALRQQSPPRIGPVGRSRLITEDATGT